MGGTIDPLGELGVFAGTWVGGGDGHYPTIDDFSYEEEIDFTATPGKPFLAYRSRTWSPGRERPMHTENGYLRRAGDAIELLVTQPTGFVEIQRGDLIDGVLDLTPVALAASPDAKPVHEIRRRITVDGDALSYDLWMAHADTPLTHHLTARLRRA
ncbi:FABP family protein [Rhodococcus sp. NPDC058505]|uniref:FABP family protein n=1 Tax=unclassified Rhodococcus (in: high G+C Gram-positive bacteria) TaxID=192944 RepID=UPI00365C0661